MVLQAFCAGTSYGYREQSRYHAVTQVRRARTPFSAMISVNIDIVTTLTDGGAKQPRRFTRYGTP